MTKPSRYQQRKRVVDELLYLVKDSFQKNSNNNQRLYHFSLQGFTNSIWRIDQLLPKNTQLTLLQAKIRINLKWLFKLIPALFKS